MFLINWVLSAFVCGIARLLLNLAETMSSAGRSLYRPLPRYEIEQILKRTNKPLLHTAIKTVRVGLRSRILKPRYPFENFKAEEVADFQDDILLDLYAEEIAGLLAPSRLMSNGLKQILLKLILGSDGFVEPKLSGAALEWRMVSWPS
jgi:hypothetical protein